MREKTQRELQVSEAEANSLRSQLDEAKAMAKAADISVKAAQGRWVPAFSYTEESMWAHARRLVVCGTLSDSHTASCLSRGVTGRTHTACPGALQVVQGLCRRGRAQLSLKHDMSRGCAVVVRDCPGAL